MSKDQNLINTFIPGDFVVYPSHGVGKIIGTEKIQELVFNCTKEFFENSDYELNTSINEKFRLIGNSSPLDSMGLVSLIVDIEESINDEFDVEIVIASEKAMSAKTSPFINLEKLILFIEEELNLISEWVK